MLVRAVGRTASKDMKGLERCGEHLHMQLVNMQLG